MSYRLVITDSAVRRDELTLAHVTITLRGGSIGGVVLAIAIGLYLIWLWRPERQVRLHTEHFFHAIDGRNWETVADFIGDDYRDQWTMIGRGFLSACG